MNRERLQISNNRTRAKLYGIKNELTLSDWQAILEAADGKCFYCKTYRGRNLLTLDHLVSLNKGGAHSKENIVAACSQCNSGKRNREFFKPKGLSLITKSADNYTRKEICGFIGIRNAGLLATPILKMQIKPLGVCDKDGKTVLYDESVLLPLIAYFKNRKG